MAVIGATETAGSVGRAVLWNLIRSPFGGTVFPVNPKRAGVLGIKAYPRIGDVPDTVDLAVVVTPAATVPAIIGECVAAGVKGAVIISAGFRETGAVGAALEQQVLDQARRGRMRIIGPNCLGVMSPLSGLNATFATPMARPGNVGFISQSGAFCTAMLDWSLREMVGFSAFVSVGSMLDVGWGDLIDYLGDDPRTRSIVIYMESIGDARSFLSAAREVALPQAHHRHQSRTHRSRRQSCRLSHGSTAGQRRSARRRVPPQGVLRVNNISDLFYMSDVLANSHGRGPIAGIVTNAGGPGVLADGRTDRGGRRTGAALEETHRRLDEFLPRHWSHAIPSTSSATLSRSATPRPSAGGRDATIDGLLVVLTPQA